MRQCPHPSEKSLARSSHVTLKNYQLKRQHVCVPSAGIAGRKGNVYYTEFQLLVRIGPFHRNLTLADKRSPRERVFNWPINEQICSWFCEPKKPIGYSHWKIYDALWPREQITNYFNPTAAELYGVAVRLLSVSLENRSLFLRPNRSISHWKSAFCSGRKTSDDANNIARQHIYELPRHGACLEDISSS